MKRFSRFQKISSLVLALVMTISLAMPYVGTVEASGSDDLTGWETCSATALTGNSIDGWSGTIAGVNQADAYGATNGNYYTSDISITNIKVILDLSGVNYNQDFCISFGNGKYGVQTWDETKAFFYLKRLTNGLTFGTYDGTNTNTQTITTFNFGTTHVFEFVKVGDVWKIAIDDVTYEYDCTTFVNGMMEASPDTTVVGLIRMYTGNCKINKIKFAEWDACSTTTVSGNGTNGWTIALKGDGTGYGLTNGNFYNANMGITNLKLRLDLSGMGTGGQNFVLALGSQKAAATTWSTTNVFFDLRRDSNTFSFSTFDGSNKSVTHQITNVFDSAIDLEFVTDANGKWQPAINGTIYPMDGIDDFVKGMQTSSPNMTVVGLTRTYTSVCTINNVKFLEKELTGWGGCNFTTMTGNLVNGWTIALKGDGTGYGLTNGNFHNANMGITNLKLRLDLSGMGTGGQNFVLALGSQKAAATTWSTTNVFFDLRRDNNIFSFSAFDGSNKSVTHQITNVFDSAIDLEFVTDANGKWQPAINGTIYPMDGINDFVEGMQTSSPNMTVVGLTRQYTSVCTIKQIQLLPRATAEGATIATAFENGAPIKMKFDYSAFKGYLDSNTYESIVNYGAVLVSTTCAVTEMQNALIDVLPQGTTLETTTYSSDYKYMVTVGAEDTVPDNYYVIIKNSDLPQYMDRSITAIGYIVTRATDGTYKYYFTSNDYNHSNILDGQISKSVTELLKNVCNEYLIKYDDVTTTDDEKEILENVIEAFNLEKECQYSIQTLRNVVADDLSGVDTEEGVLQREFLKYVHLSIDSGNPVILNLADYGAAGDGVTDDTPAVARVLAEAQETQKKTLTVM